MLDFLGPVATFLAALIAIKGGTWDGKAGGWRKLTLTGWIAATIAILGIVASYDSLRGSQQKQDTLVNLIGTLRGQNEALDDRLLGARNQLVGVGKQVGQLQTQNKSLNVKLNQTTDELARARQRQSQILTENLREIWRFNAVGLDVTYALPISHPNVAPLMAIAKQYLSQKGEGKLERTKIFSGDYLYKDEENNVQYTRLQGSGDLRWFSITDSADDHSPLIEKLREEMNSIFGGELRRHQDVKIATFAHAKRQVFPNFRLLFVKRPKEVKPEELPPAVMYWGQEYIRDNYDLSYFAFGESAETTSFSISYSSGLINVYLYFAPRKIRELNFNGIIGSQMDLPDTTLVLQVLADPASIKISKLSIFSASEGQFYYTISGADLSLFNWRYQGKEYAGYRYDFSKDDFPQLSRMQELLSETK